MTERQAELLAAMRKGVICRYVPYLGQTKPRACYYRSDTNARCTREVKALLKTGEVEKFHEDAFFIYHKVRAAKAKKG